MTNYAIIGDGATGTTAAFYIRRNDPAGRIRIYSDDPTAAYYRAALTNYVMGELRADQLFAVPPNFYEEFKVERVLARVDGVDTKQKRLDLSSGQKAAYDQLLVAAGARATMPPFPGVELSGVMTMRTMQDARFVMDQISSGTLKRAVVVGGGILGLELVAGLTTRGVKVTWVVRGEAVVSPPLDRAGSDLALGRCRHFGVDVRLSEEIGEVAGDKRGRFQAVTLKRSGDRVEAQLLAMSVGITPNIEFLEGSGVKTGRGVLVDEHLRSNLSNVYAGGDIAEVPDPFGGKPRVIGLWEPARYHGRVTGINMTGGSETWKAEVPYTATRLYDLDVGAVGKTIEDPTDEVTLDFPQAGGRVSYRKLVFAGEKLIGALVLGHRKEKVRERARLYRKLISAKSDVSEIRDVLVDPFFDLAAWLESRDVETEAPRALATIAGPAIRASLSTVLGKIPAPAAAGVSVEGGRRTLSGLMRPVEGLSGTLTPAAPSAPAAAQPPGARRESLSPPATLRLEDGRVLPIGEVMRIGRSRDSDLVLEDETVSAHHAEIRRQGSAFVISDLGSRNGSFVDEERISGAHTLRHGEVVGLGGARITFIQQAMAPRATTGPAGLPAEPLDATSQTEAAPGGRIEVGGRTTDVRLQQTSLGRDPNGDVPVDDPAVSWLHAQITRQGSDLYLRDLGSRNGTFVNAELVSLPYLLADGDVIHLGNTDLVFRSAVPARSKRPEKLPEPEPQAEGPHLMGSSGSVLGMRFALSGRSTQVGRDPQSPIALNDPTVSRLHARFDRKGEEWTVTDLGSTNGTFVNGNRLAPNTPATLAPGDEIKVGEVAFVFEAPAAPSGFLRSQQRSAQLSAQKTPPAGTVVAPKAETAPAPRRTVRVVLALVATKGPVTGEKVSLASLPVVIGREEGPGVFAVEDQFISGRHAEFARAPDGSVTVTDLESTNGTRVNGRALTPNKPRRINPGDKIRLGPETEFRVEIESR